MNYTDWEPLDSAHNYVEMYITDSTLHGQDEMSGETADHKYLVTNDSIFFEESKLKLVPLYKILSYKQDTLRLLVNKKYFKRLDTVFWVRFPKEEFGHYDLKWTPENTDSLNQKLAVDWNRRRWKYYAMTYNDMDTYDSLLSAGYWTWTMKDIKQGTKE